MLQFLNRFSKTRTSWLLLALSALSFNLIALYFQHVMKLEPCVLCIYERCAMFAIVLAGVVGFIAPRSAIIRYLAIATWLYGSWSGLKLAWEHTMIQLNPSPFHTCDFFVNFPSWLPLDSWMPAIFKATGDCSAQSWSLLTFDMPQWLIPIFALFLLVGALVLLAQFVRPRRRDIFS